MYFWQKYNSYMKPIKSKRVLTMFIIMFCHQKWPLNNFVRKTYLLRYIWYYHGLKKLIFLKGRL